MSNTLVMFGVLACPLYVPSPPPDPWELLRDETINPFFERNLPLTAAALLGLAIIGSLVVGLASELSARDRLACGALPLAAGVAGFIALQLLSKRLGEWWRVDDLGQNLLQSSALAAMILGALVLGRPLFFREDGHGVERRALLEPSLRGNSLSGPVQVTSAACSRSR
ncbi:MAG: hypothetical protein JNM17_35810 [Archangium sp.]|nr:hypothetical protein [Archangium sp.]